jgi:hypothetical protein
MKIKIDIKASDKYCYKCEFYRREDWNKSSCRIWDRLKSRTMFLDHDMTDKSLRSPACVRSTINVKKSNKKTAR